MHYRYSLSLTGDIRSKLQWKAALRTSANSNAFENNTWIIQITGSEHSNDLEDAYRSVCNLTNVLDTVNRNGNEEESNDA
jgi:hypothetical protein